MQLEQWMLIAFLVVFGVVLCSFVFIGELLDARKEKLTEKLANDQLITKGDLEKSQQAYAHLAKNQKLVEQLQAINHDGKGHSKK